MRSPPRRPRSGSAGHLAAIAGRGTDTFTGITLPVAAIRVPLLVAAAMLIA